MILHIWEDIMAYTPMMQQYLTIKENYQDAFVFFRLGDFYEMFFDDAINASRILEITLTSREAGGESRVPMCGIPHHSATSYIQILIENGFKVAICEQVEDARFAKGVVKREVVQVITPGTLMENKQLTDKENLFIASLAVKENGTFGLAYSDLTTGEFYCTEIKGNESTLLLEIANIYPKEVIIDPSFDKSIIEKITQQLSIAVSTEESTFLDAESALLFQNLHEIHLIEASARLYQYFLKTQMRSLTHLRTVERVNSNSYLNMDFQSKKNLELTELVRTSKKKGSLFWLIDKTNTAMGGRRLKKWIERPLIDTSMIRQRHNSVEELISEYFTMEQISEHLKKVYDLERLCGKVSFGNANAKDLIQLRNSIEVFPYILEELEKVSSENFQGIIEKIDKCEDVFQLLDKSIKENPPLSIKDGDIIKDGYDSQLDEFRFISRNGKKWIADLEQKEKEATGIKSLKIGYNRIFGYFIEVTKANIHLINGDRYERKQTLANAERYVTPELKEKEKLILEAEEKIVGLEYDLFCTIRTSVKEVIDRIQKTAEAISELDVLISFAKVSSEYNYVKPEITDSQTVKIIDGRHPVVEVVLQSQKYVPNDIYLDSDNKLFLITGPNMAGKSTYMRQVALTAILNQIGCFVPAKSAVLPIFDQIFTRIGAADDLVSGQSTFMVEMVEANNALQNATMNSLIIFDEIGRGTSTYDGMSLAQAMIEYIHDNIGAYTLFSTHYHELTKLEESLALLKNVHVSAIEEEGRLIFLHKIKNGAADKSYGIHVAKLAQIPDGVINRAQVLLDAHETNSSNIANSLPVAQDILQLSLFDEPIKNKKNSNENKIIDELLDLKIMDMTPLQTMNYLYELQKKAEKVSIKTR
ncbi:MAG: mismatch repair protein MutS [Bacillales bacterium]|jgi:DNA mismatch repair protein MutS|nr:mismatch repair protein MutS [Bacillales bacterium]